MLNLISASLLLASTSASLNINSALPVDKPKFLHHEQAFVFSYNQKDNNVELEWDIAPGYYLYQDAINVKTVPKKELTFTSESDVHTDQYFGTTIIFKDKAKVQFPKSTLKSSTFTVTYRGCAEAGLCYPPVVVDVTL